MASENEHKEISRKVNEFYEQIPFNIHETVESAGSAIRKMAFESVYPDVDRILKDSPASSVLDVGCGIGWFSLCAAYRYGVNATGIDACEKAIQRAAEVAEHLGLSNRAAFHRMDLFHITLDRQYDFVNSLGALHHTPDCHRALLSILPFVKDGGYVHVGLYHLYGRRPFLQMFEGFRARIAAASGRREKRAIEQEALALYRKLNARITDAAYLYSWFRDQVLHPHETQHSLKELHDWLSDAGFQCLSTSINQFAPVSDWDELFEMEKTFEAKSREMNLVRKQYFPGFFVVAARKI